MNSDSFVSFAIITVLVGCVGWIIYWYAKKVGRGDIRGVFDDPYDRNKILIFSAGVIVLGGLILLMLVILGVL